MAIESIQGLTDHSDRLEAAGQMAVPPTERAPKPESIRPVQEDEGASALPRYDSFTRQGQPNGGSGVYRIGRRADGTPEVEVDEAPAAKPGEPEADEKPAETTCTVNTDQVDREIAQLRKERQTVAQQLRQTADGPDRDRLEQRLAQLEQQLQAKDNDAYRRQRASYTFG